MKKQTLYIAGGILAVSALGYFLYKKNKKKNEKSNVQIIADEVVEQPKTNAPQLSTSGFGGVQYVDIFNAIKDIFKKKEQ